VLGTGSGRRVHALAQNRDRTPVQAGRPPRSFGTQRALSRSRAPLTEQERDETLGGLTERVTARMAKAGFSGRTVVLRLRFADFSRATRSRTMPEATAAAQPILATARDLLAAATPAIAQRGLTLLGLSVTNLVDTRTASGAAAQGPTVAPRRSTRSGRSVTSPGSGISTRTFVPKS
jgi:DNA polymerase IV